jgi:germination protein M
MAASKRNNKGSGSNAGTVFWLAAIVIVLFLFALNWGKIQATLARTNFHEIVKTQTGADKTPDKVPDKAPEGRKAADGKQSPARDDKPSSDDKQKGAQKPQDKTASPDPGAKAGTDKGGADEADDQASKLIAPKPKAPKVGAETPGNPKPQVPASSQAPARNRAATLYFVRIDDDGTIVRQETRRQIPASDSPLLDALAALLKGPSEDELRKSLISLVPSGTKLLSAQVRGSTAFLNFNEAFMYNHYGIEGYAGQLKQVVYTATAFPTVQDVQILIEGSKRDYLGGEGVFIGKPLSRNSF